MSYYNKFNELRNEVRSDVEKLLKKSGRSFKKSDENSLDFFEFQSCKENLITEITSDGKVYSDDQEIGTIGGFLDDGIPLLDAISICEDLEEVTGA